MKIKHLIYSFLIIGLAIFVTYRIKTNREKNDDTKDKSKEKPMVVTGIVVKPQTFDNNLSLSGSIEANEQVEIRSEVSGIVEGIFFNEGSNVTKGQILFKVNDIELKAQLTQALTKDELTSENQRRAKLLLQKEAISQEEYDVTSADNKSSKAQSQLIRAQISKTLVRAPFSGKIGLRLISPGTYITPAVLVAKLVSIAKLKITFSIPEKYASQVKINSILTFTTNGLPEKFNAKVYAIEPEIQVETRTLQVRAITENSEGKLLPGTFANVDLPLSIIKNAVIVPTEAIIPVQNGKKVFIVNKGLAKQVNVETATRTDATILILSGIKEGDTLITSGVMSLKDKNPVRVTLK